MSAAQQQQLVDEALWTSKLPSDYAARQEQLLQTWSDDVLEAALSSDKFKPWASKRLSLATLRTKRKVYDLKALLRRGIPASLRAEKWQQLLQTAKLEEVDRDYKAGLARTFGNAGSETLAHVPLLGGERVFDKLALSAEGVRVAERIMCVVANDYPQLAFCPFVAPTVTLLLHYADADGALACIIAILNESVSAHEWRYFPCSQRETSLFTLVFVDVVRRVFPSLMTHVHKVSSGGKADWSPFWQRVFTSFFVGFVPLHGLLQLMDSFCLEGCKIIFRLGLGVLGVLERQLLALNTIEAINDAIVARLADDSPTGFATIFDKSLSYSVQRSDWQAFRQRNQEIKQQQKKSSQLQTSTAAAARADHLHVPELSTPSAILTAKTLHEIWKWMPLRYRERDLDLIFSTRADGYSVQNMFTLCGTKEPLLMLFRTTNGKMFGAFVSDAFSKRLGTNARSYFGSGECFVFSLTADSVKVWPWAKMDRAAMEEDRVVAAASYPTKYRPEAESATVNSFFILAEHNSFSFGGGSSGPALYIGDEFNSGRSGRSETFANEPLAGEDSESFRCNHVEVYHFN